MSHTWRLVVADEAIEMMTGRFGTRETGEVPSMICLKLVRIGGFERLAVPVHSTIISLLSSAHIQSTLSQPALTMVLSQCQHEILCCDIFINNNSRSFISRLLSTAFQRHSNMSACLTTNAATFNAGG